MRQRTLRAAIAQTEKAGIHGTTGVIVSDDPARGAVAAAQAENADLILMGIVPRIGILRPFVRNLVEGVLALSTIPLCAVRRPARGFLTHRILVPIVFDALGKLAVDAAIGIAQQFKSTLVFCSIATGSDRSAALAAVQGGLATLVFGETPHIPTAIVRDADIPGCDSIVIATHARQGLPSRG